MLSSDKLRQRIADVVGDLIGALGKSATGSATGSSNAGMYTEITQFNFTTTGADDAFTVGANSITVNTTGTYRFELTTTCTYASRLRSIATKMHVGSAEYGIATITREGGSASFSQTINVTAGTSITFSAEGEHTGSNDRFSLKIDWAILGQG